MSETFLRRQVIGAMKTNDYRVRIERLNDLIRQLRELRGDMAVNLNSINLRNITLAVWHKKLDDAMALLQEEVASVGLIFEGVRQAVIASKKDEANGTTKPEQPARREAPSRRNRVSALRE